MRKAAALSLTLFVAAISYAAVVYKNFSQPVEFSYFASCANGGQGEMIDFGGSIETTLTETSEKDGWTHVHFHVVPHITAVGETTGISYNVVGSQSFGYNFSPTEVATGTNANNYAAVGDGIIYHVHEDYKFVISGNPYIYKITHDNFFVFCH
jgi:hypothetical protein